MKKLSFPLILLLAGALILTACSSTPSQAAATPEPVSSIPAGTIISEGTLLPVKAQDQAFTLSGQVAEVLVEDGSTVNAGDALARLNNSPDLQTALARAQQEALAAQQALDTYKASADLNLAQAQLAALDAQDAYDTAKSRYDSNKTDENQARLDEATASLTLAQDALSALETGEGLDPDQIAALEARVTSANAALAAAQAAVDALELKASIPGTVVDLAIQPGQRVSAGTPVAAVADYSQWVVETDDLTELEVVNISVGQQVNVVLDALPQLTFSGEVTRINMRYEEKRGEVTYTVTVALNDADPQMRWGMTAAVQFIP